MATNATTARKNTTTKKESTVSTKTAPKTPAKPKNYKALADKPATDVHKNFIVWAKENTGLDLDLKSVQVAFSLRHEFQRSEANQVDLKARRAAAAKAETARVAAKKAKVLADAIAMGIVPAPAKAKANA